MTLRTRRRAATPVTFKLCSLYLQYPDADLLEARPSLADAVAGLPGGAAREALVRFSGWFGGMDPLALQQQYVETFDLHKRSGLYVTFYGEGDRRQRGSVLLRLKRMYRACGLPLEGTELPDYLPVMLEFAAAAPDGRGGLMLREHRASIELIRESLRERRSSYEDVLEAVCITLGEPSAKDRVRAAKIAASGPPQETVGLEPFAPPEVMPATEARR